MITNRKPSFAIGVLLLFAAVCFAQSSGAQSIKVPSGSSVTLRAGSVYAINYQWMKDGKAISGATLINYKVTTSGSYTVVSYNAEGCPSDISDPTQIVVEPSAILTADVMITKNAESRSVSLNDPFEYSLLVKNNGEGTATLVKVQDILPDELNFESLINPSIGTATYNQISRTVLWQIDKMDNGQTAELRLKVKAFKPGIVRNTATVTALETDPNPANNASTNVKPIIGLIIANTFTPNGDGKNDTFFIPGLEDYPQNDLTILNRWGSAVYETKNYKNDWSGEGLNEGTYFYLLRVRNTEGKQEVYKGYITLLRTKTNQSF